MVLINENYLKLAESYLFSDIKKKVNAYKEQNPVSYTHLTLPTILRV